MKIYIFLFLVLINFTRMDACSCRGISDYYSFFKNAKDIFVGEVMTISENSDFLIYEFKVIDKLKGNYKDIEYVYSSKKTMCRFSAWKHQVYLIQVQRRKGKLYASYCSFNETSSSMRFKEDTSLIRLFRKGSFTLNSTYFKGTVVNGKRSGIWEFYYNNDTSKVIERGEFKNDKENGMWISYDDTTYYEKGKFIKRISFIPDNGNLYRKIKFKKESIVYFDDGSIYKKRTQKKYLVYYPNGVLKESVSIDRQGFTCKTWNKYNEDGTLRESIKIDSDNEVSIYNYCCFDD